MAEKVLTKEQKYELKKKRKKQFKWLCGIFVCGIVVVGVSLGINQYRYNKDMQMRLSDDRLNYYTTSIKNGEDIGLEDEYYDEMFLTDEDYYDISEEQQCLIEDVASSIEGRYRETNEDFGFGESNLVVGYTGVTLGISANIENDVELYVKSLFDIGEEILDYDSNCTITMYSDNSVAVLYPDRKTGDVYSTNDDVAIVCIMLW